MGRILDIRRNRANKWSQLFPQIFDRSGFDCVIGNPPYIRIQHVQPLAVVYGKMALKMGQTQ